MVNNELHHRIKNIFAIATSICSQSIREGVSVAEMRKAVSGRMLAATVAHKQLDILANEGAQLRGLVDTVVAPMSPNRARLKISGPPGMLPQPTATPFALLLHELATNATKHGASSGDKGYVTVEWLLDVAKTGHPELDFRWREHEGPNVKPPARRGLGSTLIKRSLGNATVDHELKPDGLDCRVRLEI